MPISTVSTNLTSTQCTITANKRGFKEKMNVSPRLLKNENIFLLDIQQKNDINSTPSDRKY
jgi:hypothetical protein